MADSRHLFDLYFDYVADTEPPLIYHRWSLIAAVGAFLGRRYYMPFGAGRIYPNQYIMLIGNPGTRKSSAIKTSRRVLSSAGYDSFAAEKTTKEKFLIDLEGGEDVDEAGYRPASSRNSTRAVTARDVLANLDLGRGGTGGDGSHDGIPREVFITADEFNEFAGNGNLDFLSMLGALWDWDDESATYKHRFKNSKSISIYQPTISIISGNTHVGFQQAFPAAAIGQGFLSRLILVYSEPSGRKITFPTKPSEEIAVALGECFNRIKEAVVGEAKITQDAIRALDTIYRTWKDLEDYRFKSYSTRRQTHLYKLCLICSAMRHSTEMALEDVVLANTILTWTEQSMEKALGEYGKSRNAEASQNVMSALYATREPLSFEKLWIVVRRDLQDRRELPPLIEGLVAAGKIQQVGKTLTFLPKQKAPDEKAKYVDFGLLQESKI